MNIWSLKFQHSFSCFNCFSFFRLVVFLLKFKFCESLSPHRIHLLYLEWKKSQFSCSCVWWFSFWAQMSNQHLQSGCALVRLLCRLPRRVSSKASGRLHICKRVLQRLSYPCSVKQAGLLGSALPSFICLDR